MYNLFYHLNDRPFGLKPDLKYFYSSRPHKQAIVHLRFGFEQPDGVLVLTGDKGTGKTILIGYMLSELDQHDNVVALIQKPPQKDQDFLPAILASLQIPIAEYQPKVMFNTLHNFLIEQINLNKKVTLVVDDAESLSHNCLEFIRLLSTLRMNDHGLLQIILVGSNELEVTLSANENQAFRQHITLSYSIHPLQLPDTREYIEHRLKKAGWSGDPVIDEDAFTTIHQLTGGIPYEINRYCDRMLMLGMLQETHFIYPKDIASLTSATMDKLEKIEAVRLDQELKNEIPGGDVERSFSQEKQAKNSTNVKRSVKEIDAEKIILDKPIKKSKSFLNKETLVTVLVVYIISILSVFVYNKTLVKNSVEPVVMTNPDSTDHSKESAVDNIASLPQHEPEVSPFTSTISPTEPETDTPEKDNILQIEFLSKKSPTIATSVHKEIPDTIVDSIDSTMSNLETAGDANDINKMIDESSANETAEEIAQQDLEPPVPGPAIESESLDLTPPSDTTTQPSLENTFVPLTDADLNEILNEEVTKSVSEAITDINLNQLVAQFEVAYQYGDMEQIDRIFSEQILSNNINSKKVLLDEYQKLFSMTELRRMHIFDIEWKIDGDTASGNGSFEAAIREKNSSTKQQYKGGINLLIKKREKGLEITELYYNYENL